MAGFVFNTAALRLQNGALVWASATVYVIPCAVTQPRKCWASVTVVQLPASL